jgi:exopolysaccharide production protein ExoQ
MPPILASTICAVFIVWLFLGDAKRRGKMAAALWIPLIWMFIIGTRPVSLLLGLRMASVSEDNFLDKGIFLVLISGGIFVLLRRRTSWRETIRRNKWLLIYFFYLAISVLWADDAAVALKRWIKDFGNIVMVLVVLSDNHPIEAIRTLLARYCYLMIPLTVLTIKYYPSVSRSYDVWTYEVHFTGLTLGKNLLGMTLYVCALVLFWMCMQHFSKEPRKRSNAELLAYSVLIVMNIWLLQICHSATAVSLSVLSICALLSMRVPAIRNRVRRLGTFAVLVTVLLVALQALGGLDYFSGAFAEAVGRDASFHGRFDIWRIVLTENINPLVGTGFYSFWSPERNQRLSEKYYYLLGEAHNGYIETYLNSGFIGVCLLFAMIAAGIVGMKRQVLEGTPFGALRLVLFIACILYNITESIFDRLSIIWFIMLLVMIEYQRVEQKMPADKRVLLSGHHSDSLAAHRTPLTRSGVGGMKWSRGVHRGD